MNDFLRTILVLPPQSSTEAMAIDWLHYSVILATMGGATAVTLVGLYFCFRYRRRTLAPAREQPAPTTPMWLEAGWIGGLFSLFLLWWVIGFMQYVRLRVAPEDAIDIYVSAKQWMWKFAYPDGQHSIATLYVPAGRPVKLIMTSRDVIHSFYVPDFRDKQDVVPGRITTMWFNVREPGRHPIYCAEYCGTNHSVMRGEVVALSPTDYSRWLQSGAPTQQIAGPQYDEPAVVGEWPPKKDLSLVRMGELAAAQEGCLRCHTLDGSPHIGPSWAGLYGSTVPLKNGGKAYADEAYLTESMMDPLAKVHAGYDPVMPSYQGLLRPEETAAIIELIKSIKDVPRGGALPPAQRLAPTPQPVEAGAMGEPPEQPKTRQRLQDAPPVTGPPASEQGMPPPGSQTEPPIIYQNEGKAAGQSPGQVNVPIRVHIPRPAPGGRTQSP